MGLDMYLSAKKYVSKHQFNGGGWNERTVNPEFDEIANKAGLAAFCQDPSVDIYGAYVSVNAAYWRKANQIHQWFVNNVQGGDDNCGEYYVSDEQLEELRSTCNEILANKEDKVFAEDLLPPANGFFFGSDQIDEYYYDDIQYTADRLKELLAMKENDHYVSFYYQSSW